MVFLRSALYVVDSIIIIIIIIIVIIIIIIIIIIIVTWWSGSGGIQACSWQPTGFLQCSDTVGLVIWPVKIIPEMIYYVSSGTLSLYITTKPTAAVLVINL